MKVIWDAFSSVLLLLSEHWDLWLWLTIWMRKADSHSFGRRKSKHTLLCNNCSFCAVSPCSLSISVLKNTHKTWRPFSTAITISFFPTLIGKITSFISTGTFCFLRIPIYVLAFQILHFELLATRGWLSTISSAKSPSGRKVEKSSLNYRPLDVLSMYVFVLWWLESSRSSFFVVREALSRVSKERRGTSPLVVSSFSFLDLNARNVYL